GRASPRPRRRALARGCSDRTAVPWRRGEPSPRARPHRLPPGARRPRARPATRSAARRGSGPRPRRRPPRSTPRRRARRRRRRARTACGPDSRAARTRSTAIPRAWRRLRTCATRRGAMDKVVASAAAAVADVPDGATLLFGGFGVVQGWPNSVLLALRERGPRDLTLVFTTPGVGPLTAQILAEAGLVRRIIASFAAYPTRPTPIEDQIRSRRIQLALVPHGTPP